MSLPRLAILAGTALTATLVPGLATEPAQATDRPSPRAAAPASVARSSPWPGHPDRTIVRHLVRPGETAAGLAVRYHAWTAELIRLNRLGPAGTLYRGQVLRIPVVVSAARKARGLRAPRTPPRPQAARKHSAAPAGPHPQRHPAHPEVAARRPDPHPGARPGRADGPPLRRTPQARPRGRLAGVRLAAAPGLQRRRDRGDAGDARHRPLDALVRRPPAPAARHPRQHPRRGAHPAGAAGPGRSTTTTRSAPTTRGSGRCGSTATSRTPSSTSSPCAPTSAG